MPRWPCLSPPVVARAALHALTNAGWLPLSSLPSDGPLVLATLLTHAPCTPPAPCGQLRAADATASPWLSPSPNGMAPVIARAVAVPNASAAVAPKIAKRNLSMNPSLIDGIACDPDPSVRSNNGDPLGSNQCPFRSKIRSEPAFDYASRRRSNPWRYPCQHHVAETSSPSS